MHHGLSMPVLVAELSYMEGVAVHFETSRNDSRYGG